MPRIEEAPITEPPRKLPRTEVRMVHDVEATLIDKIGLEEEWGLYPDYLDEDDMVKSRGEGEGPPEVSQEHLDQLDSDAALEEIKKLYDLNVIEPCAPNPDMLRPECLVDATLVYDWRFREGQWQWRRRCRIVAREYRDGHTTEDQYSPTSTFAAVRMLLVVSMIFDLSITAMDIKDAFLVVDQQEEMWVVIPEWVKRIEGSSASHWLRKCLPGQGNAALRWHEHLSGLCIKEGMQPYPRLSYDHEARQSRQKSVPECPCG